MASYVLALSIDVPAIWEDAVYGETAEQTYFKKIKASLNNEDVLLPDEPVDLPDLVALIAKNTVVAPKEEVFHSELIYSYHDNCRAQFGPDVVYSPPES
ncbi:hypothetical protein Lbys_2568 [Leadbetterella byssophila DSM 17132]|jgi:hypothetical protein|uniref:Uncharacterized protein n=2 Tax=Leadbetterella TaxID=319458 RepID=E4RZ11_LEAB4|nr:hypothetical protein Lbys_2568 [Leadbetterella byssophila DSM 17132]